MNANPGNTDTDSDFGPPGPVGDTSLEPGLAATLWEYFVRLVVVGLGIFFGTILASIIALFAGWIDLGC
ncbi:MAG: hypothetical protein P4L99_20060 [Chthoniobacter sp.]|nr:hypothetical protein [Chthoniobacter sp.]